MRSIEVCNRVGRWPPRLWLLTLKTRTRKRFTGNTDSSNSLASRGDYFSRWARLKNYFVGRSKHEKPQPALPPDVGSESPRGGIVLRCEAPVIYSPSPVAGSDSACPLTKRELPTALPSTLCRFRGPAECSPGT